MDKRSPTKLLILSIATLGFYQLKWVHDTKDEMVAKFGIQIPSFRIVLWVQAFNMLSLSVVILILLWGIPHINAKIASAPEPAAPSFQCQYDQAAGRPVSQDCKNSIDTYYGKTSPKMRYQSYLGYTLVGVMALIIINVLSALIIVRWLKYYAAGVSTLTKGAISQNKAINYLTLHPYGMGIATLQRAYNKIPPPTGSQSY